MYDDFPAFADEFLSGPFGAEYHLRVFDEMLDFEEGEFSLENCKEIGTDYKDRGIYPYDDSNSKN